MIVELEKDCTFAAALNERHESRKGNCTKKERLKIF
ncbi:MAG: hypothetical protein ACJAQ4_001913 [Cryomorphaceae bacterium]|jgi:hypothetical protein